MSPDPCAAGVKDCSGWVVIPEKQVSNKEGDGILRPSCILTVYPRFTGW